jgi:hypothetical protein
MIKETSRVRWVRRTRESVARALVREGVPSRASDLEDNLDITHYVTGLGFLDQRTEREISAALRWLVSQGYAEAMTFDRGAPGIHYTITEPGRKFARSTDNTETNR